MALVSTYTSTELPTFWAGINLRQKRQNKHGKSLSPWFDIRNSLFRSQAEFTIMVAPRTLWRYQSYASGLWTGKHFLRYCLLTLTRISQVICLPVGPRCDTCDLSTKGLCPSARTVNVKNRKTITFKEGTESRPQVEITLEEVEESKAVPVA